MGKSSTTLTAIILAAGESTRLKSKKSKVLHSIGGKRCIDWVLKAVHAAGISKSIVVLGKQADAIQSTLPLAVKVVRQEQTLGTAHAVKVAQKAAQQSQGYIFILCGDAPLINPQTLRQMLKQHRQIKAQATILTAALDNPFGYGRIVRDQGDKRLVAKIVEEKEASAAEKEISEVNSGVYCFSQEVLWTIIKKIRNNNRKGEFYLTDAIALLSKQGQMVSAWQVEDANELLGINTRQELVSVNKIINRKIISSWLDKGVTITDPDTTWIDDDVKIGRDTVIQPGTTLSGKTKIGTDCIIGPYTTIESGQKGNNVIIKQSIIEQSIIAHNVKIGPFSHLRPGNKIGTRVKIGNFVEINRSKVEPQAKIGHVSYIGDTVIGSEVNIGAGTITANYDGAQKHPTIIGQKSFIGSGSVLVAPNKIGKGCIVGAGAVVKAHSNFGPNSVVVGVPAKVIKKKKSSR